MGKAHWLEVSLALENELAEAVAEVLGRFCQNGVVVESNKIKDEQVDPDAPVRVYGYLPANAHLEDNKQRLLESLWHLSAIQPLPDASFRLLEDEDWMAAWKQHYRPIPIGRRLLILPTWYETYDTKRLPVRIDPSMAFGTGTHPTTQLCLEMTEKYTLPGRPVIDIGCGSGILSIAALKLGASHALGVDTDEVAVTSTLENAAANGVIENMESGLGSLESVRNGVFSIKTAPLVLANILATVIVRLLNEGLGETITSDGVLVLSGILETQANDVHQAAQQNGLAFLEKMQIEDWVALAYRRRKE